MAELDAIRSAILANVRADLLDVHHTWIYLPLLRLMSARWGCGGIPVADRGELLPSNRFDRNLLRHAQEFLAPLSEDPRCRVVRRGNLWTNPDYTPPTPFGRYAWPFTCWMVQEAIWMHGEFVAGYDWWIDRPGDRGRDSNPYRADDRSSSWDKGYILGLAEHYYPGRIRKWIDALTCTETVGLVGPILHPTPRVAAGLDAIGSEAGEPQGEGGNRR